MVIQISKQQHEVWILYMDGASNYQGARIGVHLETPNWSINKNVMLRFKASNNEVKYEALLHGLETTRLLEV